MNDLNTQQIILLCLLVSFVTSIATGITTVSLLEQAPEPVTQTINRVVERTVERVIEPSENNAEDSDTSSGAVVERVIETVVVNQEDLTVEAVSKNSASVVKIYGLNRFQNPFFVGTGIIIAENGAILTDTVVSNQASEFVVEYPSERATATVSQTLSQNGVVLNPVNPLTTNVTPIAYGDSQSIKLGQTVIALTGRESSVVATGIITKLETSTGAVASADVTAGTVPQTPITKIHTSVSPDVINAGALLLNLKGEVVGVRVGQVSGVSTFMPSNIARALLIQ